MIVRASGAFCIVILMAAVAVVALGGCWPFHRDTPTPQQQFLDALNHGHSAEASQIWLHMSQEDRIKFATNQGMKPAASPEEVKKQVSQQYQAEVGGEAGGEESIEQVAPAPGGAGLQNLPALAQPPGGAPPDSAGAN